MSEKYRLSHDDWNKLDDLLGKHGYGGYYDLIEVLWDIASRIGLGLIFSDREDFKTLREMTDLLSTGADIIGNLRVKNPQLDEMIYAALKDTFNLDVAKKVGYHIKTRP